MQTTANAPRPRGSVWTDPQVRAWLFQILAVIAVVALGWFLFQNTQTNLEKRGIVSGFGFLSNSAGFGIAQHLIDYSESDSYGRVFVIGLLNTLLVSFIGIVLASILGFILGVARLSPNWLISKLATVYIEIFRNIPPLLQILFWYFAVFLALPGPRQSLDIGETFFLNSRGLYMPAPGPSESFGLFAVVLLATIVGIIALGRWAKKRREATGKIFPLLWTSLALIVVIPGLTVLIGGNPLVWSVPELRGFNFRGGWVMIPELMALTLALTIYTAAFIAENVRSGIMAVSHGQTEAARSLGLRPGITLRLVIIPQALRVIIPPLTSQYLNLAKNSSLAAGIGYPDMVSLFAGTVLNQTGQAIEVIAITMSVYLAISISISLLMNWYNKRIALIER
ncbi:MULTISPECIES: amino acid ABC transporter permease [Pseudomonadaceae]|jgi:general L-amino acid transport system permease protein|uniref:Amino acid ABC transporter membrane protein 1, PAAT family n=2 Tax=Ectopseudomonas TaxID=3236654 RepID=A4XY91_ECTM1|nr:MULTISPECIES: amino acid ABC transporter permease [Pseudomonas]MBF8163240.1 amino acid ABC transporter permease [Pseudomonas mendocina]MDH0098824.1 amino acid ABC transporter permease [Pseudomonas sp. GD04158]USR40906.1 amino acid ABC transporter permease [Pseudomonas hydrolytica]UTH30752.1 amino acid ABC transporter permease [Pseudomonas hydrolytica]UTH37540.1 amino acid ABC transporter permease [Pseudomonas sp. KHPS1]